MSEHISKVETIEQTQLGINHLVVRDNFNSWVQVFKNVGRIYKTKTGERTSHKLMSLISKELFENYFKRTLQERSGNTSVPEDKVLDKDLFYLSKLVRSEMKKELEFRVEGNEIQKFERCLRDAITFINYVVLIRPLASFSWAQPGDLFDPDLHTIRNLKSEEVDKNAQLEVVQCVHPGYTYGKAIFVKIGVVVKVHVPKVVPVKTEESLEYYKEKCAKLEMKEKKNQEYKEMVLEKLKDKEFELAKLKLLYQNQVRINIIYKEKLNKIKDLFTKTNFEANSSQ